MTDTSGRFHGRTAVVTGASRGIGLAVAARLVAEGAKVCITARNAGPLEDAAASLGGSASAIAVAGKADDPDHQAEAVTRATDAFGPVTLLVNNTGINPAYGRMIDLDLRAARKVLEVNVVAALAWTQRAYAAGMSEHGGAVVNVSSVAGLGTAPGIGFYGASKATLIHVTRELARELGPSIRVNAVAPAVVKTDFASALYEGKEERVAAQYPLRRLGETDDIASAVAFLLSDEAAWVTGQTLVVDGGLTLIGGEM